MPEPPFDPLDRVVAIAWAARDATHGLNEDEAAAVLYLVSHFLAYRADMLRERLNDN